MKIIKIMDSNTGKIYSKEDELPNNIKPIIMESYE